MQKLKRLLVENILKFQVNSTDFNQSLGSFKGRVIYVCTLISHESSSDRVFFIENKTGSQGYMVKKGLVIGKQHFQR